MRLVPMRFIDRLATFADRPDECWNWPGACGNRSLYGWTSLIVDGKRRSKWTHRLAYELLVGPIPDGLTLDHLCLNSKCMNPRHLEPCTRAENARRMQAARRRDVCRKGHPLVGENVMFDGGSRVCRQCKRAASRRNYYLDVKASRDGSARRGRESRKRRREQRERAA